MTGLSPPGLPLPPPPLPACLQGEDGETRWVLYMIGLYVTGFMGIIGMCLSLLWLAHIIVYMLPPVPLYPMLNIVFVKLDSSFALLGVAAFGSFCLYLMGEWGFWVRAAGGGGLWHILPLSHG